MGRWTALIMVLAVAGCVPRQDEAYFRTKMARERQAAEKFQAEERLRVEKDRRRAQEERERLESVRRALEYAKGVLNSTPSLLTVEQLKLLGPQGWIHTLNLSSSRLPPEGYAWFKGWTNLKNLRLDSSAVTDASLAALPALPNLISLSLSKTRVTDAGLKHLLKHRRLTSVILDHTPVTDKGLAVLAGLGALRGISIRGTKITGVGFGVFTARSPLRALDLRDLPLTLAGMKTIGKMGWVTSLTLNNARVTDELFAALAGMPQLQTLSLTGSAVTDKGFATVATFPSLVSAHVGKGITPKGLKALKKCPKFAAIASSSFAFPLKAAHIRAMASGNISYVNLAQADAATVRAVATLGSLTSLSIALSAPSTAAFAALARLAKLKNFTLFGAGGLGPARWLGGAKQLTTLVLSQCNTDMAGVRALSRLTKLRSAALHIKDGGKAMVPLFVKMKSLKSLTLNPALRPGNVMVSKRVYYRPYRHRYYRPQPPAWIRELAQKRRDMSIWWMGYIVR